MHRTFETPGRVVVVVANEAGRVDISCRETTKTEVTLESESPDSAELLDGAIVECARSGEREVVVVRVPRRHRRGWTRHGGVVVQVAMPLEGDVEVTTASADIEVSGRVGRATLRSASGSIVAEDSAESVRATSASGAVKMGTVTGDLRVQSATGDLRVAGVTGRLTATTTTGDIAVGTAEQADVRSTSGDVVLRSVGGDATVTSVTGRVTISACGRGRIRLRSVSGPVSVGIPTGLTLRVDVRAVSGRIHSEIPIADERRRDMGDPDVDLEARTVSGDVTLERVAAPAAPAVPPR